MATSILLALGVIALAGAFMTDVPRALRAYHFNWLFFTSIAQGAVILAVVATITRALWSRPIRRIALAFVAFLPVAYLMVVPILLGAKYIFPWVEHPVLKKAAYLNLPFMTARTLILLGILLIFNLAFAFWSLRPDLERVQSQVPEKLRGLYTRLTQRWLGQEQEELRSYKKIAVLGPLIVVFWALGYGVLAWDFVMSLEPHWFSTMIGPYFFMGAFLGGIAAVAVSSVLFAERAGMKEQIQHTNYHDLGKMLFGFCIFWMYLFYSQFIVIWYGLLPIEQDWLIHRLEDPFLKIMVIVFFGIFVLPFFGLLGVKPKRTPSLLMLFACIVLLGLWFERYMLVYPSLYVGADHAPLGWQEAGIGCLFLGILLSCLMWFATRFPLFQMWQPVSEVELLGVEVTSDE